MDRYRYIYIYMVVLYIVNYLDLTQFFLESTRLPFIEHHPELELKYNYQYIEYNIKDS